ncbi:hypothetical protein Tco_0164632 [Tanacetum coccineum]
MENLNLFYQDIGPSLSTGRHLTQEEAEKEALAIKINQKFALLEEERLVNHDKYKKILDEIWKDKVELEGKIVKEDEEAVKRIQREALKVKDDLIAFIFPIRLEGKVGVTTLIAKFLILDILIDQDSPIVVGRGFLRTIGGMINTLERILSTFDGFCHQTFRAARSDIMRNAESDKDCSSAIQTVTNPFWKISVWKKAVSFLGSLPVPLKQVNWKPEYKEPHDVEVDHHDPNALDNMKPWKRMDYDGEIDDMLRIRLREVGSDEEVFTSVAWIRAFNIDEPIYAELCHEFYSTYEFDEVCADDELQTNKIIKFRLGERAHSLTLLEFARRLGLYQAVKLEEEGFNVYIEGGLRSDEHINAQDY